MSTAPLLVLPPWEAEILKQPNQTRGGREKAAVLGWVRVMLLCSQLGPLSSKPMEACRLQEGEEAGQEFCSASLEVASLLKTESLQAGSSGNDLGPLALSSGVGFGKVFGTAVNLEGPNQMDGRMMHGSSCPFLSHCPSPC